MSKIKISNSLSIDVTEYASQGNAILGIRDSGKTYSATYLAEQLMENGIPIIAFCPIGIWKHLKFGKNGNGFPVVVAGEGQFTDLPLTPESAPNIVRAAMKENISLVLDLYSMNLSKNDWKKIVEQSIRLLLYENKSYGLRHIFIEEAAEFAPQRILPNQGAVYAEVEKLARMGGNASLGYTLINQRPEEVNKAVLELCDCLFLHRQKGRHSITALGKWLDVTDTSNAKEITNSLPSLKQGECWVWLQGSHEPIRVKMPEKKTVHPDRRGGVQAGHGKAMLAADVSVFVHRMRSLMVDAKPEANKQDAKKHKSSSMDEGKVPDAQQELLLHLEKGKVESLTRQLSEERSLRQQAEQKLKAVQEMLRPQYEQMKKIFAEATVNGGSSAENGMWDVWLNKLNGKNRDMLKVMIDRKRITRTQLGLLIGMSPNSGSFNTYLSKIKSLGLVKKEGDEFVLQTVN